MKILAIILLCCVSSPAQMAISAGGATGGIIPLVHGSWIPFVGTLLPIQSTLGMDIFPHDTTHDLFAVGKSGSTTGIAVGQIGFGGTCTNTTPFINHILYAPASTHNWIDITGTIATGTCELVTNIIPLTSSGLVLVTTATDNNPSGTIGIAYVTAYAWDGNTSTPGWTRITLGYIAAQNAIQNHAYGIRSDGTVIFCVQHCYGNAVAGSLTYTQLTLSGLAPDGFTGTGFYYGTGGKGAPPQPNDNGFVYAIANFNAGDGRGEQFWGGGEGDLLQWGSFSWPTGYTNFIDYFPLSGSYSHNLIGIGVGPTSMLVHRDSTSTTLNKITLPSMTVTNIPTAAGYVAFPSANAPVGNIQYMNGTGATSTFIWSTVNSTTRHLYLTKNDASTLTDLIPALTTAAGCTANTQSTVAMTDKTYIYAYCTVAGNRVYYQYLP